MKSPLTRARECILECEQQHNAGSNETTLLSIPLYKIRNQPSTIGVLAKFDARGESAVGIVVFHLSKSYLCGEHLRVGKILLTEPV
jgi:hypothetical protein